MASLGLVIYFRLLGRLACVGAERLEQAEEDEE